ncbi:MAG TPA: HD domain-containing protein [Candidatus Limivivens intestinipullorum]|uniref:HD domain-containing protein n=1 Tax=Candidatus Limivivens intestinipullorum TaxID=2840858 RepID=A0A9D1EWB2_9FIRM|nr:HD domain-containing protein [Candidatus Limivivens intestinipullorum]
MKYIETLREGEKVGDIYLCKFRQSALTKNGKPYENVILQDKTGTIDAKIWDPGSAGINEFEALDYVDVVGDVTSFQGALQLNIKRIRVAREGEYVPGDYLPVSSRDIQEMYTELMTYASSIENPYLKRLTDSFFVENQNFIRAFQEHSAAKSVHHGFVGGLLEHTLGVVKLCDFFARQYGCLNRDLLLTAALFHDIGKIKELSDFPENDYTDDGQLLGHIVMGVELVGMGIRRVPDFPRKLASELKHCILAHHGELEYGSPKKPALPEALALNFADNVDAKMETFREALNASGNSGDWLGYNRFFESNIRKSTAWPKA